MINEVYPSPVGFLVIGKYPHGCDFPIDLITNENRQPYCIYQLSGKKLILIAAQDTKESALNYYHGDDYYLVYPTKAAK